MNITEPVTMLTDYLLGSLAVALGLKLLPARGQRSWSAKSLWSMAFFALAAASFIGGSHHGFSLMLSAGWRDWSWLLTLWSIGVASFFVFSGTTRDAFSGRTVTLLTGFAAVQLAVYVIWTWSRPDFLWAIVDYAPAMVYLLVLQAVAWALGRPSGKWMVAGVLVCFVGAGIQQSGVEFHKHFNYNDLYHLVQMVGVYLLYRGALLLEGGSPAAVQES